MTRDPAPADIVGRTLEQEALGRFIDDALTLPGRRAFLIEGEPGVGKSVLWADAIGRARERSIEVLLAAPAKPEQALSFAALRDVLADVADDTLAALPRPQAGALGAALLRTTAAEAVDAGAVGVALTAVLHLRASARPVLVAIDDTQWLDAPSARALAFALRRADVSVLLTRRSGEASPLADELGEALDDATTRLRLGPISFGALHRLLTQRTGQHLARPLAARIERASGGNPLIAVEIARALLVAADGQDLAMTDELPVPDRLHDLLRARLDQLSTSAREVVLVAALVAHPTTHRVAAAVPDGRMAPGAFEEADRAGIIVVDDGRIAFTHPLLASAARAAATAGTRRAVHRRLAETLPDEEERAHHLARGADGPDEGLAAELEAAASTTSRRGAPDVAADLFNRSSELTPPANAAPRARRVIAEAQARFAAGDLIGATRVLEVARAWIPAGPQRAEALLLLGTLYWYQERPERLDVLHEALDDAATDRTLRGRIHGLIAIIDDDRNQSRAHSRAAVELIDPATDPSSYAFAALGLFFADVQVGLPPDLDAFNAALALEPDPPTWEASSIPALWWKYTDQYDLARDRLERHIRWARESGDESSDAELYAHLAELELYAGRWDAADVAADRALDAADQIGQPEPNVGHRARALVDVAVGRLDRGLPAAQAGVAASRDVDPDLEAIYLDLLGSAHLAAGDAAAAAAAFDRMRSSLTDRGVVEPLRHRTDPDHIEALVTIGATERAADALAGLERRHASIPRPWIVDALPRCRALVRGATGDAAGAVLDLGAFVAAAPVDGDRFAMGRSLLVLGRLERQLGHRRTAGEQLDRAAALFDALPARAWSAQVAQEIATLGRRRGAGDALTPAEARVVALIALGHTNRAVADQLVLSPKTVEAHLARAYAKLDVHSRAELGRRFASLPATVGDPPDPQDPTAL